MQRILGLAVLIGVMALLLGAAAPALAESPQDKVECVVQPVIGGPNNPQTHDTPAVVSIPANNPAIRWDPADILPGMVFVPPADVPD